MMMHIRSLMEVITNCKMSEPGKKTKRTGFLLSPARKLKPADDSENEEKESMNDESSFYYSDSWESVSTDSDLYTEEFECLRSLPTWKKLKLSAYERRQQWRRKQKRLKKYHQRLVTHVFAYDYMCVCLLI